MIFALLFIVAFLIGLFAFLLSDKWVLAVVIPIVLFCLNLFTDPHANISFNLVFGVPLVAVAGLLGAYVVVLRRGDDIDVEPDAEQEQSNQEMENELLRPRNEKQGD